MSEPTERDRNRDAANRALDQWDIARIPGAIEDEIAAARAEGRAEAIEECARLADEAARFSPMDDRIMLASRCGMMAAQIRALVIDRSME